MTLLACDWRNNWLYTRYLYSKSHRKQRLFSLFLNNLFDFHFFFEIKGIRLCVWKTKNLPVWGSNLTNVNYANIGDQVKFINSMKFYHQSLEKVEETVNMSEKEKIVYECKYLNEGDKKWILNSLSNGKDVVPYKKKKKLRMPKFTTREGTFQKH